MILLAGWKLRRIMLRTSKSTKALVWLGWLWACFAWYSAEEGVLTIFLLNRMIDLYETVHNHINININIDFNSNFDIRSLSGGGS